MEIQVYASAGSHKPLRETQTNTADLFLEVWHERGLSEDLPEYVYAMKIREFAQQLKEGQDIDLTPFLPAPLSSEELSGFERAPLCSKMVGTAGAGPCDPSGPESRSLGSTRLQSPVYSVLGDS